MKTNKQIEYFFEKFFLMHKYEKSLKIFRNIIYYCF